MATLAARTKSRFEGGTSPGEDGGGVMGGGGGEGGHPQWLTQSLDI